jgi:DNA invertase Pin-like site-specific DNA recombinase
VRRSTIIQKIIPVLEKNNSNYSSKPKDKFKMKVISYCRISSDEQSNHSIPYQEETIKKYCDFKGYTILKTYLEDFSAKNFERPRWKDLMTFLQNQKTEIGTDKSQWVEKIIFLRYDRFSRNFEKSLGVIGQLGRIGVEIEMVESNIEMTSPESLLTRNIMLTLPEIENIKIGLRSREGSWKCRMSGGWTGTSLRGYNNVRVNNISTMDFNDDSPKIRESFEKVASGRYSINEVTKWLNLNGIKISKNQMCNIFRNVSYTGKIVVPPFKDEPEKIVIGLHPPLISDELFSAVQQVLSGKKRNMKFHTDKSDLYPLKGFLKCPIHGRSLSAYGSKGRKHLYHYYICTYPGSKCPRYPTDWIHGFIISILEKIKSSVILIKEKRKVFETLITQESSLRIKSISNTEQHLLTLRNQLTHLRDEFLKRNINGDTYQELRTEVESSIYHTELNLRDMVDEQNPLKKFLFEDVPTLEHIVEFYQKSTGVMKRRILGCIFSEKIYFNEEKDATIIYTKPIEFILHIYNELQNRGNKKRGQLDLFSLIAPLIDDTSSYQPLVEYVILYRTSVQH